MKLVNEMPKSGQFAVVWMHYGRPWSETWRWNNGVVEIFVDDDWCTNDCYLDNGYGDLELSYVVI